MRLLLLIISIGLVACDEIKLKNLSSGIPQEEVAEVPDPEIDPTPESPVSNPVQNPLEKICSKLDFKDVKWPVTMTSLEHMQLALALNITGSFEGNLGWKNLAGNFDGQGISMGLMQQNLGQGTLQPLWVEMFLKDISTLKRLLSSDQINSMQKMLETWRGSSIPPATVSVRAPTHIETEALFPEGSSFNSLDVNYHEPRATTNKNDVSVRWARGEVLDSRGYVSLSWKGPLENLAESATYRSLQVTTALTYFLKAQSYFLAFGFTQLRSLLLMYDFVVQNGSIGLDHLEIYNKWLRENPMANEEQKTLALLEARLTTVKDQYKSDVRARKTTIIRGTGIVHQKNRNLPEEYCFNPLE